jgi:5-deoxy-glucuronate isomerase
VIADPHALLLRSTEEAGTGAVIDVGPAQAGWEFISLRVQRIEANGFWNYASESDELCLLPLGGRCTVEVGDARWTIGGRSSPFTGQPHALYLPVGSTVRVTADTDVELAVCGARADQRTAPREITPEQIAVEIRGAGNAARQINHIIPPQFPAQRLLVVEVITPNGNWSSYPPHKHDVSDLPREADLEEIYYYRIDPPDGFGLQRLYTADGETDEAFVIKDGHLLLVPEGYHAFAVAHGYTGYYLNVLAGSEAQRTMQPADDPTHAWVRATWDDDMNEGATSWRDIDHRVNRGAGKHR